MDALKHIPQISQKTVSLHFLQSLAIIRIMHNVIKIIHRCENELIIKHIVVFWLRWRHESCLFSADEALQMVVKNKCIKFIVNNVKNGHYIWYQQLKMSTKRASANMMQDSAMCLFRTCESVESLQAFLASWKTTTNTIWINKHRKCLLCIMNASFCRVSVQTLTRIWLRSCSASCRNCSNSLIVPVWPAPETTTCWTCNQSIIQWHRMHSLSIKHCSSDACSHDHVHASNLINIDFLEPIPMHVHVPDNRYLFTVIKSEVHSSLSVILTTTKNCWKLTFIKFNLQITTIKTTHQQHWY